MRSSERSKHGAALYVPMACGLGSCTCRIVIECSTDSFVTPILPSRLRNQVNSLQVWELLVRIWALDSSTHFLRSDEKLKPGGSPIISLETLISAVRVHASLLKWLWMH